MIIIIDAYNILKQIFSSHITEHERNQFIALLNRYRKLKNNTIIAVFDGGPTTNPYREMQGGIQVIYSGKETADTYIIDYINSHKGYDILLVSSDRALISTAAQAHVSSIDARSFYEIIHHKADQTSTIQRPKNLVKTSKNLSVEIDQLMELGAENLEEKKEETPKERKKNRQRSKEERLLLKKIRKL